MDFFIYKNDSCPNYGQNETISLEVCWCNILHSLYKLIGIIIKMECFASKNWTIICERPHLGPNPQ